MNIAKLKCSLFESVIDLHNWRKQYNGNNIGFGFDEYEPNERFHYAEAYSFWGDGYSKLFQYTQNEEFLDLAKKCARWLIRNENKSYRNSSFGLPWGWKDAPRDLSYLTTTVFAGNFFLSLWDATNKKKYLEIAESTGNWIVEENGICREDEGVWFYYANHPSFRFPVINAISLASGFLSKLYLCVKRPTYKELSMNALKYVLRKQNKDGSWYYSTRARIVDNLHTGYTIEGLCDIYFSFPSCRKKMYNRLIKAGNFYWSNLYDKWGYGKEKNKESSLIYWLLLRLGLHSSETRLWGYASGIRAFCKLSKALSVKNRAIRIAEYVIHNLKNSGGSFKFKSNENRKYIRHEGHIFDALISLLM
ncbi:MAG: hypothetical protein E3J73_03755 [Candidatus Bathyarchaeum sp.]|nr:MAG: hypothetical protein E3J73_03755 [Candidatus Bathyarchaeum sp.]